MKVKSYYSESVEAAIARASQELGPEAMLLSSRRTPPESRHLGAYEVVLALPVPENGSFEGEFSRVLKAEAAPPSMDRLTREIADLRRQIERTATMFQKSGSLAGAPVTQSAELVRLFSSLVAGEVDPELAHDVITTVANAGAADPDGAVAAELARLIAVDPTLGRGESGPAVAAFIGPAGAGKTSVVVKLAIQCGIARRKRVHLISLDNERIGGADQLRTFAAVLGTGVDVLEDAAALAPALLKCSNRDLVLIDTPGISRDRGSEMEDLARALAPHEVIDTHLVLPVSMKAADLRRTAAACEIFRPSKLVFTRLDETETYGAILNEIVHTGHPVSYLCAGPLIPEDISAADVPGLAALISGERPLKNEAAAA
jgi:flagellar biosynthesis protein FlhF